VFNTVESETLTRKVTRELILSILRGQFPPGATLPSEEQLGEQFGVSRTVIREAMRTVTGIGMARSRQGRGSVVLEPDEWNDFAPEILAARQEIGTADEVLLQFLELRAVIEAHAAELAASRADEAHLAAMEEQIASMEETLDSNEEFIVHDVAFHAVILDAAGNPLVVRLFDLLHPMLVASRRIGVDSQRSPRAGNRRALTEHRGILEAIRRGSSADSWRAMTEHLRRSAGRDAGGDLPVARS
jgi:DNA-binding FadR family transcriptional regulator